MTIEDTTGDNFSTDLPVDVPHVLATDDPKIIENKPILCLQLLFLELEKSLKNEHWEPDVGERRF